MTTSRRRTSLPRRLGGGGAAAAVAVLGLTACQVTSPIATDLPYDPADGASIQAGPVEVLDVLVVSAGAGEPGALAGYAVNEAAEPVTVEFSVQAGDGERVALGPGVEIPANGAVRVDAYDPATGEFGEGVLVPEVPVPPGQVLTVRVTTSLSGAASREVPVLSPEYPYSVYEQVLGAGRPSD